jgi:class 3 adenylate cyclase/predicted ATPase
LIVCASCGAESASGQRFCGQCGSPLARGCPSCGAENPPENRFCGNCGTPLAEGLAAPVGTAAVGVSERRLVSVLFADLVGFTTLSEHRDPEEVRELLSQYFDRCRTLIERYGGTVEKFIGDAVMAVWGTPVAREDDAERAVRAALALTQAVTALGEEVGMPELRVRAGVLTGNAAVELGVEGEGMVLGDTVNTASRLQSIAQPGTVLVDDVTRRASEAAIAYEDAGEHEVKGRDQPVRAWTALRVVAGAGGARRSVGLEAPFVGRDRELQTIIQAAEQSAADGRAKLVAIVGEAGSGKSRLLWEFYKHLDGVENLVRWHQGRCLSYGEGVAYWALAEMVRTRAGISEEEAPASARQKLHDTVENFVTEERERRLVEPRLAHLLRLEERPDADRADLFSGWRLFFERMAGIQPVVLAFEDLQWADSGLLDFIDYLLEWSADHPIFILALGRQELRERRMAWEPLNLDPLEAQTISEILDEMVPGLPRELVAEISRAEGIPLYAVETIRMLQDRGILVQDGPRYKVTGDVSDLDVPETLQALVASRLDGLSAGERSLLQDASVLGQAFSASAAAALSGRPEAEVVGLLDALVAKQVLSRDDDPHSPERGQYVFLQGLLRTVAYGTLSRRARKIRHVAAARHLEQTWPGEARDIAEVLASHYLEAIRADPEAQDVATLRASARGKLIAAGSSAASLALGSEADRYLEQAAELVEDDLERAELFEQAGRALRQSGDAAAAEHRLRQAIELYERNGRSTGGTATLTLGNALALDGRLEEARSLLERFLPSSDPTVDKVVRARALAELARVLMLEGKPDQASPLFEESLTTLELAESWTFLAEAFLHRSSFIVYRKRLQEGIGVLRQAIALARERDLPAVELRSRYLLAAVALERDRLTEAVDEVNEGLVLARERGDRASERELLSQGVPPLVGLGRWDEATPIAEGLVAGEADISAIAAAAFAAQIACARGLDELLDRCQTLARGSVDSEYVDARVCGALILARIAIDRGETREGLDRAAGLLGEGATGGEFRVESYSLCVEAAIELGDAEAIDRLVRFVDALPPARATMLTRAGRLRLIAEQAHLAGDEMLASAREDEACVLLEEVGARPLLARTLLERARRREDEAALARARAIYAELGATRWLERIDHEFGVTA